VKEVKPAIQDGKHAATVAQEFAEEAKSMIPVAQSLAFKAQMKTDEIRVIIDASKGVAEEIKAVRDAFGSLRTENVALAIQYGRNFLQKHQKSRFEKVIDKVRKFVEKKLKRFL
jgi:hypothetical protein